MCLIVDENKHLLGKSKVNLKPIIVYKVLLKDAYVLKTPYQRKIIEFVDGQCVLKSKLIKDGHIVDYGIHAYRSLNTAVNDCKSRNLCILDNYIVFKAIIPKFSNYYIGLNGDIVSNKMIITDEVRWSI